MPEHQDKPDRITSEDAMDTLVELSGMYGVPKRFRSGNGPALISSAIKRWLSSLGINVIHFDPGSP